VLISDLYEGGVEAEFMKRAASLVASGVQFVTLLALSDEGAPAFNAPLAAELATLGVPAFACTPDRFPDLMAAAIQHADLREWVAHPAALRAAQPLPVPVSRLGRRTALTFPLRPPPQKN
jgi:hypothetical protein